MSSISHLPHHYDDHCERPIGPDPVDVPITRLSKVCEKISARIPAAFADLLDWADDPVAGAADVGFMRVENEQIGAFEDEDVVPCIDLQPKRAIQQRFDTHRGFQPFSQDADFVPCVDLQRGFQPFSQDVEPSMGGVFIQSDFNFEQRGCAFAGQRGHRFVMQQQRNRPQLGVRQHHLDVDRDPYCHRYPLEYSTGFERRYGAVGQRQCRQDSMGRHVDYFPPAMPPKFGEQGRRGKHAFQDFISVPSGNLSRPEMARPNLDLTSLRQFVRPSFSGQTNQHNRANESWPGCTWPGHNQELYYAPFKNLVKDQYHYSFRSRPEVDRGR